MCIFYGSIEPLCPAWHYLPRNSSYAEKIKLPFIQQNIYIYIYYNNIIYIYDNTTNRYTNEVICILNNDIKIIIIQFYFLSFFILLYFLSDKL